MVKYNCKEEEVKKMTRKEIEKTLKEVESEYLMEVNKDFGYNHFKAMRLEKELDRLEAMLKELD